MVLFDPLKSADPPISPGKKFDIVTVPEGFRTHGGDRSNSVSQPFFMVLNGSTDSFSSAHRLYRGDKVTTSASASGHVFINLIIATGPSQFTYIVHSSNPLDPNVTGLVLGEVIDDVYNN